MAVDSEEEPVRLGVISQKSLKRTRQDVLPNQEENHNTENLAIVEEMEKVEDSGDLSDDGMNSEVSSVKMRDLQVMQADH